MIEAIALNSVAENLRIDDRCGCSDSGLASVALTEGVGSIPAARLGGASRRLTCDAQLRFVAFLHPKSEV
jgi:hypothetical protein